MDAAIQLFAEHGLASVTIRQIASRAGVNPGLIHRYVGGRDELIRLAMAKASADLATELEAVGQPFVDRSAESPVARYEQLLAHLVLEDHDLATIPLDYPLGTFVVDRIEQGGELDDRAARLRAASVVALDLGWRLLEPLVCTASRLTDEESRPDVGRGGPSPRRPHDRAVSLDQIPGSSVRGRPPNDTDAPRGPDAVRRAVLDSAAALFSARGVAAVALREVAVDARVHPSLVHRYVGNKDDVLSAVLADLVDQLRDDLPAFAERADEPLPPGVAQVLATHQRIVTHLVIEGRSLGDYQFEYPVMDHIIAEMQRIHGIDAATARRRGALIYAHDVAMRLFLPVLLAAVGLDPDDADDLQQAARQVNLRLSSSDPSGAA